MSGCFPFCIFLDTITEDSRLQEMRKNMKTETKKVDETKQETKQTAPANKQIAPARKSRADIINQVKADASSDAREYLDEVVVPDGGE